MAERAAAPAPRPGRPRVVGAGVEWARRPALIRKLNAVVEAGGSAVLLTADGSGRSPDLAAGVEFIDLAATERRVGLNRLLSREPGRLVAAVTGRGATALSWAALIRSKPYRMVRPWLLWRALRRHLAEVRVGDVDHVIIVHPNSWPIAWQLHRRNPALTISYEIPDDVWTGAGRPVPPPQQTETVS